MQNPKNQFVAAFSPQKTIISTNKNHPVNY